MSKPGPPRAGLSSAATTLLNCRVFLQIPSRCARYGFGETIRRDGFGAEIHLRQHLADARECVPITVASDEYNRYVAGVQQPFGGLYPWATLIEIDIHQHEIRPTTRCEFDSLSRVRSASTHLESKAVQRRLQVEGDERLIFDDQCSRCHCSTGFLAVPVRINVLAGCLCLPIELHKSQKQERAGRNRDGWQSVSAA